MGSDGESAVGNASMTDDITINLTGEIAPEESRFGPIMAAYMQHESERLRRISIISVAFETASGVASLALWAGVRCSEWRECDGRWYAVCGELRLRVKLFRRSFWYASARRRRRSVGLGFRQCDAAPAMALMTGKAEKHERSRYMTAATLHLTAAALYAKAARVSSGD